MYKVMRLIGMMFGSPLLVDFGEYHHSKFWWFLMWCYPWTLEPSLVRGADCVVPADVGRNIKLELKLFSLLVFNNFTFCGCENIFWSESGRLKCLPPVFWPVSGRLPPPMQCGAGRMASYRFVLNTSLFERQWKLQNFLLIWNLW